MKEIAENVKPGWGTANDISVCRVKVTILKGIKIPLASLQYCLNIRILVGSILDSGMNTKKGWSHFGSIVNLMNQNKRCVCSSESISILTPQYITFSHASLSLRWKHMVRRFMAR